jgi:FkbM family methyltransferase
VGESGKLHCFEPTAYAIERFMKNIALNDDLPVKNIILNKIGLLAEKQEKNECIESRFSDKLLANQIEEFLRFSTIDLYCKEKDIVEIDFLKIDVDGYDLQVIHGGKEIIEKSQPLILCEFCNRVLLEKGDNLNKYIELYISLGYNECVLIGKVNRLTSLQRLLHDRSLYKYNSSNELLIGNHKLEN